MLPTTKLQQMLVNIVSESLKLRQSLALLAQPVQSVTAEYGVLMKMLLCKTRVLLVVLAIMIIQMLLLTQLLVQLASQLLLAITLSFNANKDIMLREMLKMAQSLDAFNAQLPMSNSVT
jgi:hypothetical protein